jgi:EAL domain-containing protein (putative c-di-GMP-specific phosphodiesterase class I)
VGGADQAARLHDEVFAIATARPPVAAFALAARVRDALTEPFNLPGTVVRLGANVGLAELAAAASVGDAMSRAEEALRQAHQLRSGGIEWYDEVLAAAHQRRRVLQGELPGALDRGELELLYQPVLDLSGRTPIGADALLRWRHPRLGTVSAGDLVPVAESVDLIEEIGAWVLHQACAQLARWLDEGWDLRLGVQLSARQLAGPEIVDEVACALHRHHLPAERLILEVTEQSLGGVELTGAVSALGALRSLGVRTALVQYGMGSTPLAWLRRLPVDLLKVDRAVFTAGIPLQRGMPTGEPLIGALVGLGRRLGLQVVADGLEEESQVDLVRAAGCRYGQGQVFGRPTPAEHFEAYLETHRSPTA